MPFPCAMKQDKTKKLLWKGVSLLALTIATAAGSVLALVSIGSLFGLSYAISLKIIGLLLLSSMLFDITKLTSLFMTKNLGELSLETDKLQGEPIGANS